MASAVRRDVSSPTTWNSSGQKTLIIVAQLPAGTHTTSAGASASARNVWRATLAASAANPAFHAGCPQHVAASGTRTSMPRRRRTRTVAMPTWGATVSTTHVGNRATRVRLAVTASRPEQGLHHIGAAVHQLGED